MPKKVVIGRPKAISKEVLQKLEEVFALGGSDREACLYAGISPSTLYNYQQTNNDFLERKELLKEQPILKARRTVIESISKDPRLALMFLERKKREEFSLRTEVKGEGFGQINAIIQNVRDLTDEELNKILISGSIE